MRIGPPVRKVVALPPSVSASAPGGAASGPTPARRNFLEMVFEKMRRKEPAGSAGAPTPVLTTEGNVPGGSPNTNLPSTGALGFELELRQRLREVRQAAEEPGRKKSARHEDEPIVASRDVPPEAGIEAARELVVADELNRLRAVEAEQERLKKETEEKAKEAEERDRRRGRRHP